MTEIKNIVEYTNSFAPFSTAADFDNVGLLVGSGSICVDKVLVALDITPDVVKEAVNLDTQLIISHHPVIFTPARTLSKESVPYMLAENSLSALCLHTNLDIAKDTGVNLCLAKKLGLENIEFYDGEFLLSGELKEETKAETFAEFVKESLGAEYVTCTLREKSVKKVFMCSGAGGSELVSAFNKGADVFLTGEAHHHNYLESLSLGLPLITAGHFETEDVVILPLIEKLSDEFPEVTFIKSKACVSPLKFI